MGLTVPASFTAAERAEVNQLSQKVYLLLGNYASSPGYGASATSSGADASGDYPASGPINGDRTEINIGSAAAADNGVGKASWKSSGTPDAGDLVWHKIDLGQARTFNRLKLYHRNGHGLKSFFIEASADDVTYYVIAATSDAVGGGLGWGEGAWGDGNWGGGGGEPTPASFATTMQLDTIDLPADVTYRYIRTVAQSTQVAADKAEIVALEVYRKIDVSDRVIGIDIDRQQDYKLKNNLASACNLELSNVDRFFSARYVPTDAETAAGFVNSELRPGLGIIVELGYYGVNVSLFVGSIDSIASSSRARTAMITARDGIKGLVNNVVSTKLKTNSDIGTVIQYLLNQANISNYEMSVDSTTIVLDYFFTYATSILTTIQQLQQACGDANFRFDESGVATFRMYMNAVSQSHTDTSKADFEAGVLRNIDTATTPGQYSARYTASGSWTIATTPAIVASVAGVGELSAFLTDEDSAANNAYGTWEGGIDRGTGVGTWWIVVAASIPIRVGYRLEVSATDLKLIKRTRGGTVDFPVAVDTTLLDIARAPASGDTYKVTRDGANLFTLYVNGVSMGTVTDAIWTVSTASVAGGSAGTAVFTGLKITTAGAAEQPRYLFAAQAVSQTIDMTAAVTSLGSLSADYSLPGASSISWYTATSDDGATWDAWVAAAVGTPIASAVKRYLKYKAVLNIPASASGGTTPIVFDVTVTWGTGSGSSKYPSTTSYAFRYDGSLLDLDTEITDDLGGDTAILNSIEVQSTPLILSGADTDTQWQATTNVPADKVSAANPIGVAVPDVHLLSSRAERHGHQPHDGREPGRRRGDIRRRRRWFLDDDAAPDATRPHDRHHERRHDHRPARHRQGLQRQPDADRRAGIRRRVDRSLRQAQLPADEQLPDQQRRGAERGQPSARELQGADDLHQERARSADLVDPGRGPLHHDGRQRRRLHGLRRGRGQAVAAGRRRLRRRRTPN
jgi:hypothetical protein